MTRFSAIQNYTLNVGLPPPSSQCISITLALRVVRRYRDKAPTTAQLMADFDMSRATAYRWIAALKDQT